MDYAFKNMGVRRIIAEVNTRNDKSNRLVERLGMRREAEHKEIFPNKGWRGENWGQCVRRVVNLGIKMPEVERKFSKLVFMFGKDVFEHFNLFLG